MASGRAAGEAARFSVGDRVRLVGGPERYPWIVRIVGRVGTVAEVDTLGGRDLPVYGVEGLAPGDPLWFGASFLEAA